MKKINIKGKDYVPVNERVIHFRENYPNHKLTSEIVELSEGVCIIKAEILNEQNEVIATGLAYEKENSTFINKTSYIENCETSAWGRALGNLGIGIGTSIASSEEVGNAIKQQDDEPEIDLIKAQAKLDKKNLPSELLVECGNDKELSRKILDLTIAELGYKDWKAVDFTQVSKIAFKEKFLELLKQEKDLEEAGI